MKNEGPDLPNTLKFESPGFQLTTFNEGDKRRLRTVFKRKSTPATRAQGAAFTRGLSDLAGLRAQVNPAFGALTAAGVGAIDARRTAAIGNLRENLARRRIAGSSFGEDAISRGEAEFGKAEAEFRAAAKLQEIDAFSRLLTQEQAFIQTELARELSEAGFGAQLGANFTGALNKGLELLRAQAASSNQGLNALTGGLASAVLGPTITQGGQRLSDKIFSGGSSVEDFAKADVATLPFF